MSIIFFPDRVKSSRELIRQVHQTRHTTVLVASFLEKAYSTLREEVWGLNREEREQIPPFNSVFDLSERHANSEIQRVEVSSALLCIAELAHFIGYHERNRTEIKTDDSLIIGVGLGQLCAAAVSCATTIIDLPDTAVDAVRLAFRTGAAVENLSVRNEGNEVRNGCWSLAVPIAYRDLKEELTTVQDLAQLSHTDRVSITTIGDESCTINGTPARLHWLEQKSGLLQSVSVQEMTTTGVWHSGNRYSNKHVAEIVACCSNRKFKAPRGFTISSGSGLKSTADDALALFTQAIGDILRQPIQWPSIIKTIAEEFSMNSTTAIQIFGFDQCHLTENLRTSLQSTTATPITVKNIQGWISSTQAFEADNQSSNPAIAIVGMSGRFPGAPDVDELWELLIQGKDMHRKIPKDRFDVDAHYDPEGKKNNTSHTPYGCFIEEPGLFDPRFFNMSPREATSTDPMHRLALVTAYEALEMSGFVLNSTPSSQQDRVGTFYGQTSDDWREVNAAQNIETYFIPGGVRAFAPGRISYHFGFRGPSYSVDTACSSSLAAIQVACSSLKSGECDTAVAGGVNVLTAPDIFAGLSKGQFLSKTGSCKTWDSKADGYCRADGVGSVVLKRLDDAIKDKNNILGVVLSTATNHSADAISITHPHAGNQAYLYQSVMHDAGVNPLDVSYVEMHGTGTQAGDMAEIRSVSDVFAPEGARGSKPDNLLHIGALKSNIGHGEAAAGIGALIKVLLMFQKNMIPRHIGIKNEINPRFPDLHSRNMRITYKNIPWVSQNGRPKTAFLNNFSAAGGNTAMLLQEGPATQSPQDVDARPFLPFVISAKSMSSLQRNIQQIVSHMDDLPRDSFSSLSYTLTSRRMHHTYRVGVTASNFNELRTSLLAKTENFSPTPSASPKLVFLFTGQGAYYAGLGKSLFDHSQKFRSTIEHLDGISKAQGFPSFLQVLENPELEQPSALITHLALVCTQIALVQLWECWGVKPALVMGHSLGEYAALYAAGVLSMEDAVYLVGSRASLLETKCQANTHAMLLVKGTVGEIRAAVGDLSFDVACLNSPSDTVITGSVEETDELVKALKREGLQCTLLDIPYAFHSAQIEPILPDFEGIANAVIFKKPKIPVVSPFLGEVIESEGVFNAAYLCKQARGIVNFTEALENARTQGHITEKTIFLEVGPHPICSRMVKNTLSQTAVTVTSLNKNEDSWKSLSNAMCSLHCAGVTVDFREFHREFDSCHTLLNLPAYSFDNKNYWIDYVNDWCLHKVEPRNVKAIEDPQHVFQSKLSTTSVHRIVSESFGNDRGVVTAQSDLTDAVLRAAVQGHQVNNTSLFSSSIYADIALTLGDYVYRQMRPGQPSPGVNCGDMEVFKPLIIKDAETETRVLEIDINSDLSTGQAKVTYRTVHTVSNTSTLHATCLVKFEDTARWTSNWNSQAYLIEGRMDILKEKLAKNQADKMSRGLLYRLFSSFVDYKLPYQGMEEVVIDGTNFEATSRVVFQTKETDGNFFCCPYWIDSLMHLAGFILNGGSAVDTKQFVYISHGWKALRFAVPLVRTKTYHSYVKMQETRESNVMAGDVYVFDGKNIIAMCVGLKFQRIPRTVLNSFLPPQPAANNTTNAAARAQATRKPITTSPSPRMVLPQIQTSGKTMNFNKPISTTSRVLDIISAESELPLTELQDDCTFANLGIDSLLSLQILGKLRESLDLDLPANIFIDCETVGDLKKYLDGIHPSEEPSSGSVSSASISTAATSPSILTDNETYFVKHAKAASSVPANAQPTDVNGKPSSANMIAFFQETISEQMGIAKEEVTGSNDLLSLGMDSLMSICILGIIREKTDLDLPSDFFQVHNCIDSIKDFLNPIIQPAKPPLPPSKHPQPGNPHTETLPRAPSILLQPPLPSSPHPHKTLFLIPDGSGSATSYVSLPRISPSLAVYALNSPYMRTPALFTNGIRGIAAQYLEEIRRRQPKGPYYLGGWSAGGVVAYEMVRMLLSEEEEEGGKEGEKVGGLVLLDAPCPINLEALPSRLHHFFAEVGLIGTDNGKGKAPEWLLGHFAASIQALTEYTPQALPQSHRHKAPRTLAVWAKRGVCGEGGYPRPEVKGDETKSMKWLLEDRVDFGSNGWEMLLGQGVIETMALEGNHFTIMKEGSELQELAGAAKKFLEV